MSDVKRRTLFDIGADLLALDQLLDDLDGDVTDASVEAAVTAWTAELAADESRKLDNVVGYLRQLDMEEAAARAQAEQWQQKARSRAGRAAWMKELVRRHLLASGRTRAATETGHTVSVVGNGGKVPLDLSPVDPDALPDRFTRRVLDPEAVRAALEAGEELPFARLGERGSHVRVK